MKLGVFTILFNDLDLGSTLDLASNLGLDAVEIGTGGYSKSTHCDMEELLRSDAAVQEYLEKFRRRGLFISALGAQGNPVHPNPQLAERYRRDFEQTVLLAERLGVDTVLVLSGCPGGAPGDTTPNWVTCAWPEDYPNILAYQWNDVLIPYWCKAAAFARAHGVTKIGVEPHPGFCVYNTETLLKLRQAVGEEIGVNFDPSHLFWQGIDPVAAIRAFGGCIWHVHAKDTGIDALNTAVNGVLDAKPYSDTGGRSWIFRTVGYGHPEETWRRIVSALAGVGYDGVLSIEHEDCLMTREEGLAKAAELLGRVAIRENVQKKWWETRPEG